MRNLQVVRIINLLLGPVLLLYSITHTKGTSTTCTSTSGRISISGTHKYKYKAYNTCVYLRMERERDDGLRSADRWGVIWVHVPGTLMCATCPSTTSTVQVLYYLYLSVDTTFCCSQSWTRPQVQHAVVTSTNCTCTSTVFSRSTPSYFPGTSAGPQWLFWYLQ